ncbi:hypothetical protein [Kineosporia succinea]|uniref:Uncharacterized protein n=1 Tax=Kineosporia succinea TaxID=84632 RepID=A0ABT9PEL8_9ACTN|nr:hypothetical protein [Kineosporia succinea]MDP9830849.1 hypothetical protein [Kineosporia succinea]
MKKVLIGILVLGVLGVGLLAGGGYFVYRLFNQSTVSPEAYEAVRVGDSQSSVGTALSDAVAFSASEVYGDSTTKPEPVPEGATCEHYMSGDVTDDAGNVYYRFCFSDGKLTEKTRIVIA